MMMQEIVLFHFMQKEGLYYEIEKMAEKIRDYS